MHLPQPDRRPDALVTRWTTRSPKAATPVKTFTVKIHKTCETFTSSAPLSQVKALEGRGVSSNSSMVNVIEQCPHFQVKATEMVVQCPFLLRSRHYYHDREGGHHKEGSQCCFWPRVIAQVLLCCCCCQAAATYEDPQLLLEPTKKGPACSEAGVHCQD